jgi:hypothetical protein
MTLRVIGYKALAAIAGLALSGIGLMAVAGPASASTNVDQRQGTISGCDGNIVCLTYAVNETGSAWSTEGDFSNLCVSYPSNCQVFTSNGTGKGAIVRNDAHSMVSGFASGSACDVYTFVSPNYEGASDFVEAHWMGNLSSGLLNNEASIKWGGTPSCN